MCAWEVVAAEAGLAFAAAVWRCLQGYTWVDAGKDIVPWVINLLSSENAAFLMCPWPLTSPPGLLWQPVGGDVLCKLGQCALKHRAPTICLHNWWHPSTCLQPEAHQEDALTKKAAVKYLRNSQYFGIFYILFNLCYIKHFCVLEQGIQALSFRSLLETGMHFIPGNYFSPVIDFFLLMALEAFGKRPWV